MYPRVLQVPVIAVLCLSLVMLGCPPPEDCDCPDVHFKDMGDDGIWTEMGRGAIDFPALVRDLRRTDYTGWIMVEDESPRAEDEPDEVTRENGRYVAARLS